MSLTARIWQGFGTLLVGGALLAAAPAATAAPLASGHTAPAHTNEDTTPPTKPTNLHVVFATVDTIRLAWDPATDDSGVVLHQVFFDDNPSPLSSDAHDGQFDVKFNRVVGLIPGSTHTFFVRAEDTSGNATDSDTVTGTFAEGDNTPPTAPNNLRVAGQDATGVQLTWQPSVDASDFHYFLDGAPCGPITLGRLNSATVPSISADPVCGLLPGSTYVFSVRARDVWDNDSASSNTVRVTFKG